MEIKTEKISLEEEQEMIEEEISQVKACAQSIIDNARSIVGELPYRTNLMIVISLPVDDYPTITVSNECLPSRLVKVGSFDDPDYN